MYDLPENAVLYADSAHGIYIPQHFAESIKRDCVTGIDAEQYAVLESGPDHESYWDVWCEIEQSAIVTDSNGQEFCLYQDGDLWLVPTYWQPQD